MKAKRIVEIYKRIYAHCTWLVATESLDGEEVILSRDGTISAMSPDKALPGLANDLTNRIAATGITHEQIKQKLYVLKRLQVEVESAKREILP